MLQRAVLTRALVRPASRSFSTSSVDLFNKTEEHAALRDMVKAFAKEKVDPQAMEYDREESSTTRSSRSSGTSDSSE